MFNPKFIFVTTLIAAGLQVGAMAANKGPKPHISSHKAGELAAKAFPGTVKSVKYEFEDKRWQYAVIVIQKGNKWLEVEVDSNNGKILDHETTTAAEEQKEAAADAPKGKGATEKGGEKPD